MALEIPGCPNNLHKFERTMTQAGGWEQNTASEGPNAGITFKGARQVMAPINTAVGSPHQVTGLSGT